MGIELPLQLNFLAFALPGLIAALAMLLFVISSKRSAPATASLATAQV